MHAVPVPFTHQAYYQIILLPMSVSEDIYNVYFLDQIMTHVVMENNRCVCFRENRQDAISVILAVKIGFNS